MLNQGYHNSGKPITVVPEFKKYFNKTNTKATRLDKVITIKKNDEDGQTHNVKFYIVDRWIVGPLGRNYVLRRLHSTYQYTRWI